MVQTETRKMSVFNMKGGAVVELADLKMAELIKNIMDPNTEATAKRGLDIKVKIIPSEDREYVTMEAEVIPKPAPNAPISTGAMVGKTTNGSYEAREMQPHTQSNLFKSPESKDVIPIEDRKDGSSD